MKNKEIPPRAGTLPRQLLGVGTLLSVSCFTAGSAPAAEPTNGRPNILWLIVDDIGVELPLFGEKAIETPHIDRLAAEGILFTQAIVTAPVCSAARSALITGMYQTTIGAKDHQSGRGANRITLPEGVEPLPVIFQRHGFFTSNGDFPPGRTTSPAKTDYNFTWDRAMFDEPAGDWSGRAEGQPFFSQLQLWGGKYRDDPQWHETEARRILGQLLDPETVSLPPYYPRDPALLRDHAQYLDTLRVTDLEVGRILADLEKQGILEQTYIFFLGDNGISHARGKQFLYDEGIRTPLIVRGPGLPKGVVRNDPVEHIDIASASLALAGLPVPAWMQAQDILAADYRPREAVFAARDRCGETVDRIRAVRTDRYKYIRNFYPDRPLLQPTNYKDTKEILQRLRALHAAGELDAVQERILFAPSRPAEELYDLRNDPFELDNLAGDPAHAAELAAMRKRLAEWSSRTADPPPESDETYALEMRHQVGKMRGDPVGRRQVEENIALMQRWAKEKPFRDEVPSP